MADARQPREKRQPRGRLDVLLVESGFASSREKAQAMILAGEVMVDGQKALKAGHPVSGDARIEVAGKPAYVSRGGLKMEGALTAFGIDPTGMICLDVGASTGGFTDCVLQRGARAAIAVDVGYGQLAWTLRQDPRVSLLERCNVRHLEASQLPDRPDFAVVDASFISLTLILGRVAALVAPGSVIVAMVKPQFEVGKGQVGRGGVVRDPALHAAAVARVRDCALGLGLTVLGEGASPILGPKGNREVFLALRTPSEVR